MTDQQVMGSMFLSLAELQIHRALSLTLNLDAIYIIQKCFADLQILRTERLVGGAR